MPDKPIAKRAKKKNKRGEKNKGVGCLTPVEQRKHTARDNRDRAFAIEYLRTMCASKAGKAIGLAENTLKQASWAYLRKPAVQKIIQEELSQRIDAAGVTAERIINRLAAIAFAVSTDYAAWDKYDLAMVNSGTLTRDQSAALQGVVCKRNKDGPPDVSFKMHDSVKALDLLARIKRMISTDGKASISADDARSFAETAMETGRKMKAAVPEKDGEDGGGDVQSG